MPTQKILGDFNGLLSDSSDEEPDKQQTSAALYNPSNNNNQEVDLNREDMDGIIKRKSTLVGDITIDEDKKLSEVIEYDLNKQEVNDDD